MKVTTLLVLLFSIAGTTSIVQRNKKIPSSDFGVRLNMYERSQIRYINDALNKKISCKLKYYTILRVKNAIKSYICKILIKH